MGARSSSMLCQANFHDVYSLGRKLGQGSFGQVRACNRRHGDQKFVVKILDTRIDFAQGSCPSNFYEVPEDSVDMSKVHHIRDECLLWRKLGSCDYCVELFEVYASEGMYYLVMERCECSLLHKLEDMSQWSEREMRTIFQQMLLGIDHAHTRGVVHRDVKPDNFLYGIDKIVKLADFGLSAALGLSKPSRFSRGLRRAAGTPPYMSPEMLSGKYYDHKTDIWSYGVSVYFMVYTELPYGQHARSSEAMQAAIINGKPAPSYKIHMQAYNGSAEPENAQGFIEGLLMRSPKKRLSAAKALVHDFFSTDPGPMWGSSESSSSSIGGLGPLVQLARQTSGNYSDKTKLDPMVATDLDELLSKLQQARSSSGDLRRSFSLPVPAKAKSGNILETLEEEDECGHTQDNLGGGDGEGRGGGEGHRLNRGSSTLGLASRTGAKSNASSRSGWRRSNTHEGPVSGSAEASSHCHLETLEEMRGMESDASMMNLDTIKSTMKWTSSNRDMPEGQSTPSTKDDWSEGTWSDELDELDVLPPPPPPRLPPAHAAASMAASALSPAPSEPAPGGG